MSENMTLEQLEAEVKRLEPIAYAEQERKRRAAFEVERLLKLKMELGRLRKMAGSQASVAPTRLNLDPPVQRLLPALAASNHRPVALAPRAPVLRAAAPAPTPRQPGPKSPKQELAAARSLMRNCEAVGISVSLGDAVSHVHARRDPKAQTGPSFRVREVGDRAGAIVLAARGQGIEVSAIEAIGRASRGEVAR